MSGILQPDGSVCYSGPNCKRHGALHKKNTETWSVYFDFKTKMEDRNWLLFPQVTDAKLIPSTVKRRIENWAVRNNASYEWAETIALSSKEGWRVVVHPEIRRQSWQEEALFTHLKQYGNFFTEAEVLPKSKSQKFDALTLRNGELIRNTKNVIADDGTQLKTLDGFVTLRSTERKVYIVAKYTEGKGGSQDNQANEALRSIREQKPGNDFLVAAILDGDYYQKIDRTGKTWIERHQKNLPENTFLGSHQDFIKGIYNGEIF